MNSADQWRELTERYSRLNEDGLRAACYEAYDLTETARSALCAEIRARGLDIPLKDVWEPPRGKLDPTDQDLAVVDRVWSRDDARRAKQILDDAGFPCNLGLGRDNCVRVDDLEAAYENGPDVKVRAIGVQRARWALGQLPAQEETATAYSAACPRCKSPEIVFCGLDGAPGLEGSVPTSRFYWQCDACGHHWKDDGGEER